MPRSDKVPRRERADAAAVGEESPSAAALAELPDDALVDAIQRQTCRYFWEQAHPASGLAYDRRAVRGESGDGPIAIGGSGFGAMALIVAAERGWISREAAVERLLRMLELLSRAQRHHGAFPHFLDGATGATIPFSAQDDGGDVVETALLFQGLLCARQYFDRERRDELALRAQIDALWREIEWRWFTRGRDVLYWHWSPRHGWAKNHEIRGWNECLIAYVLAAASPTQAIEPEVYHRGYASGAQFRNGAAYYGIELPLGPPYGGPLFFAHYSFCGLDPRGLADRYADYWQQNLAQVRINRAHCLANPHAHAGYGEDCWGLTASDDPDGYLAHAPDRDNGTLSPTAALASLPYAPRKVLRAARHLLRRYGEQVWGACGFCDAFNPTRGWYANSYLAIDQGPIVAMLENHRSGLLWRLFMSVPEVRAGLRRLGFACPQPERT